MDEKVSQQHRRSSACGEYIDSPPYRAILSTRCGGGGDEGGKAGAGSRVLTAERRARDRCFAVSASPSPLQAQTERHRYQSPAPPVPRPPDRLGPLMEGGVADAKRAGDVDRRTSQSAVT